MKMERLQVGFEKQYGRLDRRLGGVLSLLVRTALAFDQDDGPLVARSIAYYTLFAVFPAILAFIVVASTVLNTEEVQEAVMGLVSQYMPMAYDLVAANIQNLLSARGTVGLVALAGLIWEAGKAIFAWYVSNIASYSIIYGSVGAIIAFMLWAYLSGQLLLLGAEFTVVYSRWRRAGRPLEALTLAELMADQSSPKVFEGDE